MCGIAGYRAWGVELGGLPAELANATRSLHHRGPDDDGQWIAEDGSVGFGHRRLAILDLSPLGHQPMISACGQWVMVFNGEIYNFRDIRAELEPMGHRFKGCGDSEVILAAFSQWGPEAVKRFIGMFAIALWHKPTRELHLIRDRLGVKPLYYQANGRFLCFGSELKALREFKAWAPEVDPDGLLDFFRHGYIGHPRTIYRGVHKLPPAHRAVIGEDGRVQLYRYWSALNGSPISASRSEDDLADELESLMISAFKYRMVSDVPVGVFLSGGIDSSALAAVLQRHSGQQISTYTIGFDVDGYDESPHAEAVARYLGTRHTTRHLTVDEAMRILPGWGELYDEPFGDASGIPTLLVSRMAAESVKVVLSADGGDELFAGYTTYESILRRLRRLERIPQPVRSGVRGVLRLVPWQALDDWLATRGWPGGANHSLRARSTLPLLAVQRRIAPQPAGRHFDVAKVFFSDRELGRLLGRAPLPTRPGCDEYPRDIGDRMCLWDLEHYMPEDILTKVDRATMAMSIEGREPLLDHRLVEFAFSLPYSVKHGSFGTKHLLRKVLYRYVPRELVDRPKKGFSVPLGSWFDRELKTLPEEFLNRASVRKHGLFDADNVQHHLARLRAGDPLAVNRVWLLAAFQMWHARWMSA